MWKVENMFVELNDPVREIPGQNVFLPVAYSKWERKQKQRLLYMKKLGFDCFEMFKPLKITKDVKINKMIS